MTPMTAGPGTGNDPTASCCPRSNAEKTSNVLARCPRTRSTYRWTVCELRLGSLSELFPAPISGPDTADRIGKALLAGGAIDATLEQRLSDLRRARNKWLHSGKE